MLRSTKVAGVRNEIAARIMAANLVRAITNGQDLRSQPDKGIKKTSGLVTQPALSEVTMAGKRGNSHTDYVGVSTFQVAPPPVPVDPSNEPAWLEAFEGIAAQVLGAAWSTSDWIRFHVRTYRNRPAAILLGIVLAGIILLVGVGMSVGLLHLLEWPGGAVLGAVVGGVSALVVAATRGIYMALKHSGEVPGFVLTPTALALCGRARGQPELLLFQLERGRLSGNVHLLDLSEITARRFSLDFGLVIQLKRSGDEKVTYPLAVAFGSSHSDQDRIRGDAAEAYALLGI